MNIEDAAAASLSGRKSHLRAMITRSLLSSAVPAAVLLLCGNAAIPARALSLFGFGSSSDNKSAEDARARDAAIALIKENAAADDFVPPAAGVGRQDAARFAKARAAGKLVCSSGEAAGSSAEISWDRINDDFCDCPGDGSDEPGTSACSNGKYLLCCGCCPCRSVVCYRITAVAFVVLDVQSLSCPLWYAQKYAAKLRVMARRRQTATIPRTAIVYLP